MVVKAGEAVHRLLKEDPGPLLGTAELARRSPQVKSRPPVPSTITRYMLKGLPKPNGERVRLEHVRLGKRLVSTEAALMRFFAALQDGDSAPAAITPRSPAARSRASERAASELAAAGI